MVFRGERENVRSSGPWGGRPRHSRASQGVDMPVMRGTLKGVDRLVEPRWIAGRHRKCDADKIYITCWHSCARSKLLFLRIRIWFFFPSPPQHHLKAGLEGLCWVWDRCERPRAVWILGIPLGHTLVICIFSAAFEKGLTLAVSQTFICQRPLLGSWQSVWSLVNVIFRNIVFDFNF